MIAENPTAHGESKIVVQSEIKNPTTEKAMKSGLLTALVVLVLTTASAASMPALAGSLEFKSFQTHSHLTIPAAYARKYSVELVGDGKTNMLRLTASGENTIGALESPSFSDQRTNAVIVRNGVIEIVLTADAVTRGVEYFDYRTKNSGDVSIDYWFKNAEPTVQNSRQTPNKSGATASKKSNQANLARKKITSKKSIHTGVCSERLDLTKDGYTYWNIYHVSFPYSRYFNLDTADAAYEYPFSEQDQKATKKHNARELAHYRLALKLNKESKLALLLRTIAFFEENFPKSELKKELDFLRAATFVRLAKMLHSERYFDQALDQYRRIYFEAPTDERGRRALAYLVQMHMEAKNYIQALEYALVGAEPANAQNALSGEANKDLTPWVYRLAAAETLFLVGEYDRAERSYQLIVDANTAVSPEALFRLGEVYSARNFWERAVLSFEKAQTRYPKLVNKYPSAMFNLAEAYFRIGKTDLAQKNFKEYIAKFPQDSSVWAANLRIAEIEHIHLKSGDVTGGKKVKALYDHVVNNYPYTPGAELAQLRLSECSPVFSKNDPRREFYLGIFKAEDLKVYHHDLVNLSEVEHWFNLAKARFGLAAAEFDLALSKADLYRTRFKSIPLGASFAKVYHENVVASADYFAREKQFEKLLEIDAHFGDLVTEPKPISYLLPLLKANFEAGRLDVAQRAIQGLASRVREMNAKERDGYYAIAARHEWLLSHDIEKTGEYLNKISDSGEFGPLKLRMLAEVSLAAERYADVIATVGRLEQPSFRSKMSVGDQMEAEMFRLEALAKQSEYQRVAKNANDFELRFGVYDEYANYLVRARDLRAAALYELKDYAAAIRAFSEILARADKHPRRAEFEFKRARSLASVGREDEAKEGFQKIAKGPEDFGIWRKSAQTELEQLQWENDIKNQTKDRRSLQ